MYAVRDSLFEQLGADTDEERRDSGDAAVAETVRANRTKFFDVVVPIVPFISHRNARELLEDKLEAAGITGKKGIERRLVALVAQHATDMRLLTNITNEYLVFAERLLETPNSAPGLTPNKLFALVAYKNFHLADFESIARSASDLDTLNGLRREVVRTNVERLEANRRRISAGRPDDGSRQKVADQLARRLQVLVDAMQVTAQGTQTALTFSTADGKVHEPDAFRTFAFWRALATGGSFMVTSQRRGYQAQELITFDRDQLKALVPDAFSAHRWEEIEETDAQRRTKRIDVELRALRGADFIDLVRAPDYELTFTGPDYADRTPDSPQGSGPFGEHIDRTLKSELARDLVKRGHIDRNFTLYAAQFYGTFSGTDVATFLVQNVQTNTMEVNQTFDSINAIPNLLEEAGEEFTHTVAAYNNTILDYLLAHQDPRALDIVDRLVTEHDDDAQSFLASYLTSGQQRERLVAHLAASPWPEIFTHLVTDDRVPDPDRPGLLSAALVAADGQQEYHLGDDVAAFVAKHYEKMGAFTHPQTLPISQAITGLLTDVGTVLPRLAAISEPLLDLVITSGRFDLTAANLRVALARVEGRITGEDAADLADAAQDPGDSTPEHERTGGISLDRILTARTDAPEVGGHTAAADIAEAIYNLCLRRPAAYLGAVENDDATTFAVDTTAPLQVVLTDIAPGPTDDDQDQQADPADEPATQGDWAEHWDSEQVEKLLALTDPGARLNTLADVPATTWAPLADANLFTATLRNVETYLRGATAADTHLSWLLAASDAITGGPDSAGESLDEVATEANQSARAAVVPTAVAILNSPSVGPDKRIELARGLHPTLPLPVTDIVVEPGTLLAGLVEAGLVEDDHASFMRFRPAGWEAIGPAIASSSNFTDLADSEVADVVVGMVAEMLKDPGTPAQLGRKVVNDIDTFVPEQDPAELAAVGTYLREHNIAVSPHLATRLATARAMDTPQVLRLLATAQPAATASDIMEAFRAIGGPYATVASPGETFETPKDDVHERLLGVLKDADVVRLAKRRGRQIYDVEVL